ncbi:alpha-ketoglutarate-dependent dioxygenase AlkB [Bradyrhizobium sp. dw_78]|uniref:alpha-ketoglutarate-dependent dioxygenase AlkB n=1 Tax=Bradyrhizobium sp. dw_78 TaxID=2719793 RepID=UPI001BD2DDC5|nr:alpha-ketoglutarate-dependent dioxygenase AlkB [Bradyrhizobium sp. dw_78]
MPRLPRKPQVELELTDPEPFPAGLHYLPGYFDETAQGALVADVRQLLVEAPLFKQSMPKSGAPLSVRMSNAGDFGWVTDREGGYRYQTVHPVTGKRWPPIPTVFLDLWQGVTSEIEPPNMCLINFYDAGARLGLHQDKGESSLEAPVVSVSLGDEATFSVGGMVRKDPVRRLRLRSGDVVWFGGPSRLIFHGVEGIRPGTSPLLEEHGFAASGRINITLRRIGR